jgi:hypothetical protein
MEAVAIAALSWHLEGAKQIRNSFSQESWWPSRDSNQASPEYKLEALQLLFGYPHIGRYKQFGGTCYLHRQGGSGMCFICDATTGVVFL